MHLAEVKQEIAESCRKHKRKKSEVKLIAVSKFHGADKIEEAIEAGQMVFGENRIQEAEEKFPALKAKYKKLELHFIGHLQSNKVKEAVSLFDVIQSLDSIKLADELAKEMKKQNRHLPCFIQVNTGNEDQKGGVEVSELPHLFAHAKKLGLNIVGLMCIPPVKDIPDMHFALMNKLAKELGLKELSMGMSSDFDTGIKYGATCIRIGTAIFGERK